MQKLGLFMTALAIMLFCIVGAPTFAAENEDAPTKESFIAAWEVQQRKLPTTLLLEKKADNVYLYETTIFPFKGEIRILNVVIDKSVDYYADYDLNYEDIERGVLEIELVGITREDLREKYPHSFSLWDSHNYLFFSDETKRWLSPKEMGDVVDLREEREEKEANKAKVQSPVPEKEDKKKVTLLSVLTSFLPVIFIFVAWGLLCWPATRQQKSAIKRYDEFYKQTLIKQDQAISLQKEAIALLNKIAEKK
jgi:hypothetical protein